MITPLPQPKITDRDTYFSGKSISSGRIRKMAQRYSEGSGLSMVVSEKIVRRTIARQKVRRFYIPVGLFSGNTFQVGTYKVYVKRIKMKVGRLTLCKWRADGCSCPAGSQYRCWHQDYADYVLDHYNVRPQKYGMYSLRFIKKHKARGGR